MSTSTNLPETRLFTSLDPYHRDVDNRPLQDLDDRDTRLAEAVDSEVSAKNVLALAVGLLAAGVLQTNKVVGSQPLTITPLTLTVGMSLLTQQVWDGGVSAYAPTLGVDLKSRDFTFTTPAATFQRPHTIAARVSPLSGVDTPWFDGSLADTVAFSKVGNIEWTLLTGVDEAEGVEPTWPVPVSGWVPVFHVVTNSSTVGLLNGTHVFYVNFRQQGSFQKLLPWADSPGKMLMVGTNTGMEEVVEGTFGNGPNGPFPLVWDWPVPPPPGPNYVLTSTGLGAGEYQWQLAAPSAIGNGASNCFLYYDSSIDCLALSIRQPGLFVDGTYRMVPTPTLSTTALADDTFWHVYGYWTGTTLVMETSASGYTPDPYGGEFFYKVGSPAKTLLGIFYKKAGTVCFTRSAFVDQDQYASINPSSGSYPQDVVPYSIANLASDFQWELVVDGADVEIPPAPAEIPNYELVVLLFAYERAKIGVNLHLKYHLNGTVVGGGPPSPYAKVRLLSVSPSGGATHRDFMINDAATVDTSLNDYWKGTLTDAFTVGSPAGQATVRKVRIRASRLGMRPQDDLSYIVAKDLDRVWQTNVDTGTHQGDPAFAFESVDTLITLEKESPVFSGLRILGFKQVPKHLW